VGRLSPILRSLAGGLVAFWCPGCHTSHALGVVGIWAWGYNGNPDAPTFTPSVKITGIDFTPEGLALLEKDRIDGTRRDDGFTYPHVVTCCHSFVTDGQIKFLGDCTHALANQTVPIPPWPDAADASKERKDA